MIAAGLTITYDRSKVIGLSFQFDDDQRVLLIPYPELEIVGNIDGRLRVIIIWPPLELHRKHFRLVRQ